MASTIRTTEFNWKTFTFIINIDEGSYQEKHHYGEGWQSIAATMENPSIDKSFKTAIKKAFNARIALK